jgi:hypothetical protein
VRPTPDGERRPEFDDVVMIEHVEVSGAELP